MSTSSTIVPPRRVLATRYATPLREGGSLPAIVEADDDGLYVVKFRGAGHGPRTLVAEWVVGELARALGLRMPELVEVCIDAAIGRAEADPEIQHVILGSVGSNIGLDYLPGSVTFDPASGFAIEPDVAARVVWLDSLVTNIDRMPQNPNLLVWHGEPWLIDHGAALYVHANWSDVEGTATQRFDPIAQHVLLPSASSITAIDAECAARIDVPLVAGLLAAAPDDWFAEDALGRPPDEVRAAYVDWFARRLAARPTWVGAAEEARTA